MYEYVIHYKVVGEAGIEPTTPGLEGRCSIQLSYSPRRSLILTLVGGKVHLQIPPGPSGEYARPPPETLRRRSGKR